MTLKRRDETPTALSVPQVECLLIAILTVNNYSLEKAWNLLPRMRELSLTDPARVVAMDMPAAIEVLTSAGYDRKNLTWMFAERVKALMLPSTMASWRARAGRGCAR